MNRLYFHNNYPSSEGEILEKENLEEIPGLYV